MHILGDETMSTRVNVTGKNYVYKLTYIVATDIHTAKTMFKGGLCAKAMSTVTRDTCSTHPFLWVEKWVLSPESI